MTEHTHGLIQTTHMCARVYMSTRTLGVGLSRRKEERARGILGGRFGIVNNQLGDEERSKQVKEKEEESDIVAYMM